MINSRNTDTLTPSNGRLIGYARVSTEEQRLDMQLDALHRAGCDQIFHDHGVSGGLAERPGLDEALNALARGDTLVVYKLDRLGRSVLHLAELVARFECDGIQFRSLTEGIDTTTSGGRLVFNLFASVAEFERELASERTRNGLRAAKERGAAIGRPRAISDDLLFEAHQQVYNHGRTFAETAIQFEVSESTLVRGFRRLKFDDAA